MKKDYALNIIASIITVFTLQVLCYPVLSRMLEPAEYGLMLAIIGVVNAAGVSIGSSLNNARLLTKDDVEVSEVNGAYNRLVLIGSFATFVLVLSVVYFLLKPGIAVSMSVSFAAVMILAKSYHSVAFRLSIDYRKVVVMNLVGLVGYIVGLLIAYIFTFWPLAFIFGESLSALYALLAGGLLQYGFDKEKKFISASKKSGNLLTSTAVANVLLYLDRFLLLPLLGAAGVASFTVASLLGKSIGMVAMPITGVLLTYYARDEARLTQLVLNRRALTILAISAASFFIVLMISKPVLGVLYPDLVSAALPYIIPATAAGVVYISGSMLHVSSLVACPVSYQPIMQVIYLVVYIVASLTGLRLAGLAGFCWGLLIANLARFLIYYIATTFSISRTSLEV